MSVLSRVLIIEDSPVIVELVRLLLHQHGYEELVAEDGRRAKELIASIPVPAAVILDIMLPYADGFELLGLIRRQPGWEKVPVIMLTAKTQEKDLIQALELGADDYVVKPFRPAELAARLERHIKSGL